MQYVILFFFSIFLYVLFRCMYVKYVKPWSTYAVDRREKKKLPEQRFFLSIYSYTFMYIFINEILIFLILIGFFNK